MDGIGAIADSIRAELRQQLPHQRKTQRGKLALVIATMLDVRSASSLSDLGLESSVLVDDDRARRQA
jgi:hypothetical protein